MTQVPQPLVPVPDVRHTSGMNNRRRRFWAGLRCQQMDPPDTSSARDSTPEPDPHARWNPIYALYLEQARWLLLRNEQRSSGFQQTAVGILGFTGVILVFAGSDTWLNPVDEISPIARAAGLVALVAVALSALVAVSAFTPRTTASISQDAVIQAWANLHEGKEEVNPGQHFTDLFLTTDPIVPPQTGRIARAVTALRSSYRRMTGLPPLEVQPLRAAHQLAEDRARAVTNAARLLAIATTALLIRAVLA